MKVTISVGGPFPTPFRLAEFLEREDCLERMITFMPKFRLKSRLQLALDDSHLVTLPWLGYLNYIRWRVRFLSHRAELSYWISDTFDRLAARRLGTCDLFNGWCSTALHSIRQAKAQGAVTVLNTGSAHIAFQNELLEAEYAKFGQKRTVIAPRLVEKGTQEFVEADHIVVASTFVKRTLLEWGIEPSKISVVPDALTRHFDTQPKTDAVFRIIAVGQLGFRKGIQYLLKAVSHLRLPSSELLLVGGLQDEFIPMLREYAGYYRLAGYVPAEKLGEFYSQASVFVLPSVEDGWGHVTLEAMSCGLPAIVSANAGSADAVQDGVTGFVVPACNAQAILEKIEFLYNHPELRDAMGRQAQVSVQQYSPYEYGRRIKSIFETLLQNRKPAP
jgi:glycosyltransferase involved in cell wall biosynthesis